MFFGLYAYFRGMDITLSIKKTDVYDEVAKTTSYVGLKQIDADDKLYDRVFTTDADRDLLERFWQEACNAVTDEFKQFIISQPGQTDNGIFTVDMSMPSSFDVNLVSSVEQSLFSFFINLITAKWFSISNKGDAEHYQQEALASGNEVRRKIFYRKKPQRVIPID